MKYDNNVIRNGLACGGIREIVNSLPSKVFSFVRSRDNNEVVGLFNLSGEECSVTIRDSSFAGKPFELLFSGTRVDFDSGVTFRLKPWGYKIFYRDLAA